MARVTIPTSAVYTWESQAVQYAPTGEPGIGYERNFSRIGHYVVDCLLWRDDTGALRGILNHYPVASPWERPGNVNIWVEPSHQHRGIATRLVEEALQRWSIDPERQRYTQAGLDFVRAVQQKKSGGFWQQQGQGQKVGVDSRDRGPAGRDRDRRDH